MKKIIYKGTIEENDYNRVKDIDSENYITQRKNGPAEINTDAVTGSRYPKFHQ